MAELDATIIDFLDGLDLGEKKKVEPKAALDAGELVQDATDSVEENEGTGPQESDESVQSEAEGDELEDEEDLDLTDVENLLDTLDSGGTAAISAPSAATSFPLPDAELDDPLAFMENSGLQRDREVPDISYPWMEEHKFTLVRTVTETNRIVDECIKRGFCSLDLETEGLDNRIIYDKSGKPETVHKVVGYCISYDGVEGFYIPVRHRPPDGGPDLNVNSQGVEEAISRLCHAAIPKGTPEAIEKDPLSYKCERPQLVIAFWNAQFDQEFLYPITGIDWWHPESFEDGMLAAFTVYAGDKRLSLKVKAHQMLQDSKGNPYQMIELKQLFFGRTRDIKFYTLAPDEPGVLNYTGADGVCTYKLCQHPELVPLCHEKHELTYKIEKQTTCVLRVMERHRVRITRDEVRKTLVEQEAKRKEIYDRIQKFAQTQGLPMYGLAKPKELDPNSPKQLSDFLFSKDGMDLTPKPDILKASGQYKTDAETLKELAKSENAPPILKDIVEFREVDKFIGTYLIGLANNPDENDELRFSFKQTGAASGRFSAPAGNPAHGYSGIPVHGIPGGSEIRRVFQARPGYTMVKADYAGEELRIAANVSQEPVWIEEFLHGSGDLHTITARAFYGKQEVTKEERKGGKTANFSLLYGGGPKAIIRATGCSHQEARRRKQAFDKAVPVFAEWIKGQHKRVKKDKGVYTAYGRWLPIPDALSDDGAVRAACERHSVNYVIQGTGADIMKISMILLHKAFHRRGWLKNGGDDSVRMLLTVHDEVVLEVRHDRVAEVIPLVVDTMESPWKMPKTPPWRVPLVVEPLVGFNWASGYEARRVTKDHPPKPDQVVMNGFAYDTKRKPRTNKKEEIVESLDQNEVQDGKFFRIVDAPWFMGHQPGERIQTKKTEPKPVDIPDAIVASEKPPEEPIAEKVPEPEKVAAPEPESEKQEAAPEPVDDVLLLRINQLNEQTVEQVFHFAWLESDNSGPILHLTDIVGTTIVPTSWNFRVAKDKLIAHLRKYNLLCPEDFNGSG